MFDGCKRLTDIGGLTKIGLHMVEMENLGMFNRCMKISMISSRLFELGWGRISRSCGYDLVR